MKGNFKALIQNRTEFENHNPAGVFLSLPATKEELHEAMEALNITAENPKDFFLNGYVTEDGRHIEIPQEWIREADLDEVNFLAARLDEMPPIEFDKLEAIMHSDLKLGSLEQLIDYTFNMDCFEHIPDVYTRSDLGDYYLNDSGMVQMPEEWKSGIDKEDFGGNAAICENGHFTDHGYIKSTGREWQVRYEEKNIPDQYRIMSFPERESILSDKAPQMQGTDKEIHSTPIELKAQNPAEKVKEITEKLEQGVQDLLESNRFKEYLKVMSKFHNYSVNNLLLISMQNPNATLIAGYNSWKNLFGRQVLKGEKGIKILAPAPYKVKKEVEKIDPKTHKAIIGENGKPVTEQIEVTVPAYKVVSVFDVSQTNGRELPQIGANELFGEVDGYDTFFEAISRSCPVPIEYEKIPSNAKGYCTADKIALKEGMSQIQNIKTVIHELAHHKLHFGDNRDSYTRNKKEVEAESVAYTICQHYGIDTSEYSFGYIAGWSAGKKMAELKESLGVIQKASSEIINEIDNNIEELQRIEKEASQEKHAIKPSVLDNLHKKKEQVNSGMNKPDQRTHNREAER